MQAEAPDAEYLPATHSMQAEELVAPLSFPYLPAPHSKQAEELVAPVTLEYLPVPHSLHTKAPFIEYLPCAPRHLARSKTRS